MEAYMAHGYPILLELRGRPVLVVGGGRVASRKVADLLAAGAEITLISPTLHPDLEALGDRIDVIRAAYQPGAITEMIQWDYDPLLVFAATDSREANEQVMDEAYTLRLLVDVADAPETGSFTSMATIRRGSITLALATGGASPALAAHLRERLETEIGAEYVTLSGWLRDLRPKVRARGTPDTRRDLWRAIVASPALALLRAGDEAGARAIIDALVEQFKANS
jgi:siroheme synthase-like protein